MSFGQAFKQGIDTAIQERERRFNDPTFQAELAQEQQRFLESLGTMGARALDAGIAVTLKAPLTPLWVLLKQASKGKIDVGDVFSKTLSGVGEAGWKATQFAASILVASGRGAKLGIRAALAI